MNKFNINHLFNSNIGESKHVLDVKTIYQPEPTFNINIIIKKKDKLRKQLLEIYIASYNLCIKKIEVAASLNKTDLLYTVDGFNLNHPDYKSLECIKYIKDKLKDDCFDAYIVDNKTLFITWVYLEINTGN
jgi:hypothetical protein